MQHLNRRTYRLQGRGPLVAVGLALALLTAAGCARGNAGGADGAGPSRHFTPKVQAGIPGALLPDERKLWTWDTAAKKYVEVSGSAATYEPKLGDFPPGTTIAYQDPQATNAFAVPIKNGVYSLAKKYGVKIIYCDSAYKADKAVSCAESLVSQKPNFAIAGNWVQGVSPQIAKIYANANIPTTCIDICAPSEVFFGANNYEAGNIGGKAAGKYAKSKWQCKDLWVLQGQHLEEGEAVNQRIKGFSDGVQEICGSLPKNRIGKVIMVGDSAQALTTTTDWLTAHPQAVHVVAASLDDERASGIAKAFQSSNSDGVAVGLGCDNVGIDAVSSAQTNTNHWLGCVAYFPEKYPEYLLSVARDVLAKRPVPNEIHMPHKFLDHNSIGQYYK